VSERPVRTKPTIRDVARDAGVSIKTVSRVTNGDDNVASDTAERVREAITRLGYRANPLARSLRTGQDEAIGLMVESIGDPFFASVTDAVEEAAREAGLVVIITSAGRTPHQERAVVNELLHRSLRGLIIVPCQLDYAAERFSLGPGGVPVVFVDRPALEDVADSVLIDNIANARAGTEHLIAHGHRRIAFVGTGLARYPLGARVDGYRAALAAAGIPVDERLIVSIPYPSGDKAPVLTEVLASKDPATAVLSGNALASLAVVRELHQTKRTDIALVSFDDFAMADALDPPITVASQDPVLMGRRAFELLLERIAGEASPGRRVILPTHFIARGSGELPPPPARP
jgi:LacI family transcriptional regulator, galactose operon repressor